MTAKLSTRVCRTPQQLVEAAGALATLSAEFLPIEVSVARCVVKRTNPQNDRLWWLHTLRAQHLNAGWPERATAIIWNMNEACVPLRKAEAKALLNKVWNADEMHEEFKRRYLAGRSSTQVSKMMMIDKLTEYEADLRMDGVDIPTEPEWEEAA